MTETTDTAEHNPIRVFFSDAPRTLLEDAEEGEPGISSVPVMRQLFVALGLLTVVFGTTYVGTVVALFEDTTHIDDVFVEAQLPQMDTPDDTTVTNAFEDTVVTAKAAYVWDVQSQRVLFNKNADAELPLASVTKLMTALVAYELLDDTSNVNISVEAIRQDGDSGFSEGETFSLRDLTDLTLIASSNDGAEALSAQAGATLTDDADPGKTFIDAMNIRAEELGLAKTHFMNATGLDLSPSQAGAYGSARDMAFLMEYIITHYPDVVALTKNDLTTVHNEDGEYHIAKNTNEIVDDIQGLIASKTGYTELAGGNLVIAFDAGMGHPIIVSVSSRTRPISARSSLRKISQFAADLS